MSDAPSTDLPDNVVAVDFGKEAVESARKLKRLLGMVAERDAEMLRDPKTFFDLATDEIIRLRQILEAAEEALRMPPPRWDCAQPPTLEPLDTLVVDRAEHERLRAAARIVQRWRDK